MKFLLVEPQNVSLHRVVDSGCIKGTIVAAYQQQQTETFQVLYYDYPVDRLIIQSELNSEVVACDLDKATIHCLVTNTPIIKKESIYHPRVKRTYWRINLFSYNSDSVYTGLSTSHS